MFYCSKSVYPLGGAIAKYYWVLHCEAIVEGKEDDIDKRSKIVIEIKYLNIVKLLLATIIFIQRMLKFLQTV